MGILKFLLFLLSISPIVHSEDSCTYSWCGEVLLAYPFILEGQKQGNNCTYFNPTVTCSDWGVPVLSLPFSGNFYVRYIDYLIQRISLYDPINCLPTRLMNNSINLSSSPFTAKFYDKYTFYTCPVNSDPVRYPALPIGCLSNSTNTTVATSEVAPQVFENAGCKSIGSSIYPVMYHGQFEWDRIYTDILLTWNVSCLCDQFTDPEETGGSLWHQLIRSPFFLSCSVLLVFFFLSCCVQSMKMKGENADHNSTTAAALPPVPTIVAPLPLASAEMSSVRATLSHVLTIVAPSVPAEPSSVIAALPPIIAPLAEPSSVVAALSPVLTIVAPSVAAEPSSVIAGLDDSKIKSYTELVVVGENQSISGHGNSSCAICLETYNSKEKVRSMAKCGHFFHADCIYPWLRNNKTCPVCRTLV